MQTKLITLVVSLQGRPQGSIEGSIGGLRSHIQTQLTLHGEPLRWAITAVDTANQTAQVEAVVTTDLRSQ